MNKLSVCALTRPLAHALRAFCGYQDTLRSLGVRFDERSELETV